VLWKAVVPPTLQRTRATKNDIVDSRSDKIDFEWEVLLIHVALGNAKYRSP
jgi:hypothetical protein